MLFKLIYHLANVFCHFKSYQPFLTMVDFTNTKVIGSTKSEGTLINELKHRLFLWIMPL